MASRSNQGRPFRRQASAWAALRDRKLEHWAREYQRDGALGALETAEALREHMKALNPDWPDSEMRRQDLEHHARMRALFDRAAHALIFHSRRRPAR